MAWESEILIFGEAIFVGVAYTGSYRQNGALIRENSYTLERDFIGRLGFRPSLVDDAEMKA